MQVKPASSEARTAGAWAIGKMRDYATQIRVCVVHMGEARDDGTLAWSGWCWEHGFGTSPHAYESEFDALDEGIQSLRDRVNEDFPPERKATPC